MADNNLMNPGDKIGNHVEERTTINNEESQMQTSSKKNSDTLEHFNDFLYWREPFESLDFDELFPLSRKEPEIPDNVLNEIASINEQIDLDYSLIKELSVNEKKTNLADTGERLPIQTCIKVEVPVSKKKRKASKNQSTCVSTAAFQPTLKQNTEVDLNRQKGETVTNNF